MRPCAFWRPPAGPMVVVPGEPAGIAVEPGLVGPGSPKGLAALIADQSLFLGSHLAESLFGTMVGDPTLHRAELSG